MSSGLRRRVCGGGLVALLIGSSTTGLAQPAASPGPAYTAKELASYRLSLPVFRRFQDASQRIAAITSADIRFEEAPLFTRDVAVGGDALLVAPALEARLAAEPAIVAALGQAQLTVREYTTFALALIGARLAHGFVNAGILRVPKGVPADNVAFVTAHLAEVTATLEALGIDDA